MGKASIYWNITQVLAYTFVIFFFIIGERGNGKGYGCKTFMTREAIASPIIEHPEGDFHTRQFIYLRRNVNEMDESACTFFDDIRNEFPEHVLHFKGGKFYADGVLIGHAYALKTFSVYKSIAFPYVVHVMYDEFIVDIDGGKRYLKNELFAFKEFYETVARPGSDHPLVKVFFIANRVSDINPYFSKWRLEIPLNKKGIRIFNNSMLVQLTNCEAFRKRKLESDYYKMIESAEGDDYIKYSVNNEALRDTDDFIQKPLKDLQYRFTLRLLGMDVGIYYSPSKNGFYCYKPDQNFGVAFTTESTLHSQKCMYVKRKSTSAIFGQFLNYFQNSLVWYNNKEIKYTVLRELERYR